MARQFRTQRMPKTWSSIPASTVEFTSSSTGLFGSLSIGEPGTILRVLTNILISPTPGGTFASDDQCDITLALGIFSTDAVAAGAASMPDPASEPEYPWLFWRGVPLRLFNLSANEAFSSVSFVDRVSIDSRSMRRMKTGQSLAWVGQYVDVTGAPPFSVDVGISRVLFAGI